MGRLSQEMRAALSEPLLCPRVRVGPADNMLREAPNVVNGPLLVAMSIHRASAALSSLWLSRMQPAGGRQKVSSPDERAAVIRRATEPPFVPAAWPRTAEVRICGWLRAPQKQSMGMQGRRQEPQAQCCLPGSRRGVAIWGSDTFQCPTPPTT